ncbi:hypothetical protein SAMD00019534_056850 [Acytostelium subglobosum LB1]|uniref:hypothetical protein n=1 Tax=Acytostelium subglobosum LB1 TaxID=1410327 RepID=UPI000644C26C|nr:hypothetical protein SAMD00019534_056850 [Acytostelium subglobosum LB1]GAM22510.1 hypothetical protein SAMD00019534_056850 [Acytostelium subglobosum LB1]|eukprot:XP_012754630.1 hypothetical protein SAMD00019534_056850 [Acytostelium subglobosum LB1]
MITNRLVKNSLLVGHKVLRSRSSLGLGALITPRSCFNNTNNINNINKSMLLTNTPSTSSSSSSLLGYCTATAKTTSSSLGDKMLSITRDSKYASLTEKDVEEFRRMLGDTAVINGKEDLDGYNTDFMNQFKGSSQLVLRPKSTEQVSSILRYCNERRLAVVPQGGNTGLVGGSVPMYDEIILSLSSMNNILAFDEVSGVITCEAGCVLQTLEEYLHPKGYTIPLDLGSKGSCHIGGNAATNAGGIRLLRYGSLHGNVMGAEVVLANGTVIDLMNTLRKDNTGYDMKQLFIGSEGTLGVITKLAILTPAKPTSVNVALLSCSSFEQVKQLLVEAKKMLGDILSAFEFMDRPCIDLVLAHHEHSHEPFDNKSPFYVLIETSGSNETHDMEKINNFLEDIMNRELVIDGSLASDSKNVSQFWTLREGITESLGKAGAVYKYDLSLPIDNFYAIVEQMRDRLKGTSANVCGFGHVGDCNLHLNIWTPGQKYSRDMLKNIEPFVYEYTSKYRGSISAEHGIGAKKVSQLHFSKTHESIELMRNLKNAMDPNGILNPYKVIPSSPSST